MPFGYVWHRDYGLGFDPHMLLQETISLIFARFRELGTARQVLISMIDDGVHFPRPSDGKKMLSFDWVPMHYVADRRPANSAASSHSAISLT